MPCLGAMTIKLLLLHSVFFFFVSASHATYLCFLYIYIYDGRRVFIVKYALYSSLSAKVLIMLECPEKKKNEIPGST